MKEKGTVESEAGAQEGRSDEGPPRGDRIGVRKRRWADDPWNAPGGPASPIPGLGVSKQLGQRLSSASSVYGLAAARPVAGGGGGDTQRAMRSRGTRESWGSAPPRPVSPAPPRKGGEAPSGPAQPAQPARVGNLGRGSWSFRPVHRPRPG